MEVQRFCWGSNQQPPGQTHRGRTTESHAACPLPHFKTLDPVAEAAFILPTEMQSRWDREAVNSCQQHWQSSSIKRRLKNRWAAMSPIARARMFRPWPQRGHAIPQTRLWSVPSLVCLHQGPLSTQLVRKEVKYMMTLGAELEWRLRPNTGSWYLLCVSPPDLSSLLGAVNDVNAVNAGHMILQTYAKAVFPSVTLTDAMPWLDKCSVWNLQCQSRKKESLLNKRYTRGKKTI